MGSCPRAPSVLNHACPLMFLQDASVVDSDEEEEASEADEDEEEGMSWEELEEEAKR